MTLTIATLYGINAVFVGLATAYLSLKENRVKLGWLLCTIQLLIVTIIFIELGV